jgi:hypothetical protein
MKRKIFALLALSLFILPSTGNAQILKNLLNSSTVKNVVSSVTGGQTISVENLKGTWTYANPAVKLESSNTLKNVAGSVATSEVESKLSEYFKKVGITAGTFNFTFNEDGTFTSLLKGKTLSGTYTVDESAKTISLSYGSLGSSKLNTFTANAVISGSDLKLLFESDKLLKLISAISSISGSSTLGTLTSLLNSYDGLQIGFDLQK